MVTIKSRMIIVPFDNVVARKLQNGQIVDYTQCKILDV